MQKNSKKRQRGDEPASMQQQTPRLPDEIVLKICEYEQDVIALKNMSRSCRLLNSYVDERLCKERLWRDYKCGYRLEGSWRKTLEIVRIRWTMRCVVCRRSDYNKRCMDLQLELDWIMLLKAGRYANQVAPLVGYRAILATTCIDCRTQDLHNDSLRVATRLEALFGRPGARTVGDDEIIAGENKVEELYLGVNNFTNIHYTITDTKPKKLDHERFWSVRWGGHVRRIKRAGSGDWRCISMSRTSKIEWEFRVEFDVRA